MGVFQPLIGLVAVAVLGAGAVAQGEDESPFKPFDQDAFEAHAKKVGADDTLLQAFRTESTEGATAAAADDLLRKLFGDYDKAVTQAEDGDPVAALSLTKILAATKDPYLRAHVRYHLGRVFLDADDPEKAMDVLDDYLKRDRNRTALDGEVLYFYSLALAEIPDPATAVAAFSAFLKHFPESPERYRASAAQQIAVLESQFDNPLHEIADTMKGVERRIRKTRTGEPTQQRQKDIISKLEKIIEEMEKKEKQGGGPGGLGTPNSPASNSAAPPGQTRFGNLQKRSGAAQRWGTLKDREREKIETDLQTKLPGQYRKLLQDYYKKLGQGDPGGGG